MRQEKALLFLKAKASDEGTGTVEGYASVFGGVDSYHDTIAPGAYAETIPAFLSDGFIAWGHDWLNPVATPVSLTEDPHGLYLTAQFHSDPMAQRARTIVSERLQRGKSMGLSIGYEAQEVEYRQASAKGDDEDAGEIRVLKKIKLYEVSLVTVPADSAALVSEAKDGAERFVGQGLAVLAAIEQYTSRARALTSLGAKEGRILSEANRARLRGVHDALETSRGTLNDLLIATEPVPKGRNPRALLAEMGALHAEVSLLLGGH